MIDKTALAHREGWFTSSFTNGSQTCVEVKFDTAVLVRDTKHRRPTLAMPPAAWTTFVNTLATHADDQ